MALRPEFGHVICIGMGHDGRGRGELETKALTARAVEDEPRILEAFWDVVRSGRDWRFVDLQRPGLRPALPRSAAPSTRACRRHAACPSGPTPRTATSTSCASSRTGSGRTPCAWSRRRAARPPEVAARDGRLPGARALARRPGRRDRGVLPGRRPARLRGLPPRGALLPLTRRPARAAGTSGSLRDARRRGGRPGAQAERRRQGFLARHDGDHRGHSGIRFEKATTRAVGRGRAPSTREDSPGRWSRRTGTRSAATAPSTARPTGPRGARAGRTGGAGARPGSPAHVVTASGARPGQERLADTV